MLARLSRFGPALPRLLPARLVSQSKPASATDSITVTEAHAMAPPSPHGEVSPYVKNPEYHGFSDDPVMDVWNMRLGAFLGFSVALVLGGTFLHYLPDFGMRQWARREAERVILEKEKLGLPLITEDYYDQSKIILPAPGEE